MNKKPQDDEELLRLILSRVEDIKLQQNTIENRLDELHQFVLGMRTKGEVTTHWKSQISDRLLRWVKSPEILMSLLFLIGIVIGVILLILSRGNGI